MKRPNLSLTYPDLQNNKVRLLAVTSDLKALIAFKEAVLEEAQFNVLTCDDDILRIEFESELHKLEKILNILIPDVMEEVNHE